MTTPAVNKKPQMTLVPPVIYHQGWPPPERLVEDVKEELAKNPDRTTASDLEAMLYLNTAFMCFPPNEQWFHIYMYLVRKYFAGKGWKFEGDMSFLNDHTELNSYDERTLNQLKDWIFQTQKKELTKRRRESK